MKKKYSLVGICMVLFNISIAQIESFDIARYTPPKNWKKQINAGVITFLNFNESTGGFCVIAIYNSTPGTGNAKKDFLEEWKTKIVPNYKTTSSPSTEEQSGNNGWKSVTGAAPIKVDSVDAVLVATVFSGFGKRMSVLATLNEQSYLAQVDTFLQNLSLDTAIVGSTLSKPSDAITIPNSSLNTSYTKFGTLMFMSPARWKTETYPDGIILKPEDLPKGEVLMIQLMLPVRASSIEQALDKTYDEASTGLNATKMREVSGQPFTKSQTKKSFKGWDYMRASGGIKLGSTEFGLDVFVAKINERFERLYILKSRNNCNISSYYPSDRVRYFSQIENFIFSLKFSDWKEQEKQPGSLKGDGIIGVWQGMGMVTGMSKPGAITGAELKPMTAIFFSNGQAYYASKFPVEGIDELNTWVNAETTMRNWGTYTFANGKGFIEMPYDRIPIRFSNNKLIITPNKTDHSFMKIDPVDNFKLSGTYTFQLDNSVSITFTNDGKFKDNGVMPVLAHVYPQCINEIPQQGSGMYSIKNYTITFIYTDGRSLKVSLPMGIENNANNPNSLMASFNYDVLIKR